MRSKLKHQVHKRNFRFPLSYAEAFRGISFFWVNTHLRKSTELIFHVSQVSQAINKLIGYEVMVNKLYVKQTKRKIGKNRLLFMKRAALFMLYMDKLHWNCMYVMGAPPPPMAACYFLPTWPLTLVMLTPPPNPCLAACVIFHEPPRLRGSQPCPTDSEWFPIPLTFRQFPCLATNVVTTKTLNKLRVEKNKPLITKTWIAKIAQIHRVPFTTNGFLCIKMIDSQVSKFCYNDYPFTTSRCDQWQDKYWQFINNPKFYSPNLTK